MRNLSTTAKFREYDRLWQQIDVFASDSSQECLRLSSTLTEWQRFKAYERAHLLRLGYRSDVLPDGSKVIVIWKTCNGANTKYGPSKSFQGVLSSSSEGEFFNLRKTFDRYDFNQDRRLEREEVATLVRDLFELIVDDLEMKAELKPSAARKVRKGIHRSLGRAATKATIDSLLAYGTDDSLTFDEYAKAMRATGGVVDMHDLVDRLIAQKDTWRLNPIVDFQVDIDAIINEDALAHMKLFAAGCLSGIASTCASGPLSRITVLMQTATVTSGSEPLGVKAMFERVLARDGVRGLYRGTGLEALRAAPYSGINYFAYENFKVSLSKLDSTETKFASKFCAGGLSGGTGVLLTYPIDLLRTRAAVQQGKERVSVLTQARLVYESGGLTGFWNGAGTAVWTKIPYFCLLFGVCESSRDWLTHRRYNSFSAGLLSGAFGSVITNVTFFPMDTTVKILQAESSLPLSQRKYKGAADVICTIVRQQGARGLYRGVVARMCTAVPSIMVNFASYSWLRSWLNLDLSRTR